MKNIALSAAIGLSALGFALPASANEGVSARGVVASLSAQSISVKAAHHTVNCALGRRSPSLAGYGVGDRVLAQCRRVARHLVLAKIRHLSPAPADGTTVAEPVKFGGAVTSLTDSSISLHDGTRDLTCAIGDGSPATGDVKVGSHIKVVCQNGTLVSWAPVTAADAAHLYEGAITAFGGDAISVSSGDHIYTCPLGEGSPSVADVHIGDRVVVGCSVGSNLLVLLRPLAPAPPTTPPPTPATTWTAGGTLIALTSTSITVHNDEHGDITCTLTDGSPHLGDYHVGDHVGIACTDGVLKAIDKL
jgi:hypothetical protein